MAEIARAFHQNLVSLLDQHMVAEMINICHPYFFLETFLYLVMCSNKGKTTHQVNPYSPQNLPLTQNVLQNSLKKFGHNPKRAMC